MAKAVVKRETTTVVTQRARDVLAQEFPALPEALEGTIDLKGWLASMVAGVEYVEPDPDYMMREMLLNTLTAPTLQEALEGSDMLKLQDVLENVPGATTGPIRITSLYVAPSDLDEGSRTYLILEWVSMEDGSVTRCSGGSVNVKSGFARYLMLGIWPIECEIARIPAKDQGGKHLIGVFPVGA